MKNWTENGDPILTDRVKTSLSDFIKEADIRLFTIGLRNLLLAYVMQEKDRELWFDVFLSEIGMFYDFIDDLEEQYSTR